MFPHMSPSLGTEFIPLWAWLRPQKTYGLEMMQGWAGDQTRGTLLGRHIVMCSWDRCHVGQTAWAPSQSRGRPSRKCCL